MKLGGIGSKLSISATVAAITASGLLGGIGAASADGPMPGGGNLPAVTRNVAPATISTSGPRVNVPLNTVRVSMVQALATGQGLTQKQCDSQARYINGLLASKQEAANSQNQYLAEAYDDMAETAIDAAMDAGCAIIY
jgi:hypothetical protein